MFIAMNRFKVVPGSQADFEQVWTTRDTHLREVPGFITFHLLRGPDREDHVLYSSHSIWHSRADFEAWTRSEAFRRAHHDGREGAQPGDDRARFVELPQMGIARGEKAV